jgi:hypothetical protein
VTLKVTLILTLMVVYFSFEFNNRFYCSRALSQRLSLRHLTQSLQRLTAQLPFAESTSPGTTGYAAVSVLNNHQKQYHHNHHLNIFSRGTESAPVYVRSASGPVEVVTDSRCAVDNDHVEHRLETLTTPPTRGLF